MSDLRQMAGDANHETQVDMGNCEFSPYALLLAKYGKNEGSHLAAFYEANKDDIHPTVEVKTDKSGHEVRTYRAPEFAGTITLPALKDVAKLEAKFAGRKSQIEKWIAPASAPTPDNSGAASAPKPKVVEKAAPKDGGPKGDERQAEIAKLKAELKVELTKQANVNQQYSQAIQNHTGFLGIMADGLQNTIGASSKNANPLLAFWGSHICNKDEGSDRFNKVLEKKNEEVLTNIHVIQSKIKELESAQSKNWQTEINDIHTRVSQLKANAEETGKKIGHYDQGKSAMEDGIADTAATIVGTAAGANLAVGALTKLALKSGDAAMAHRSYNIGDAAYDASTGALSVFALGKGFKYGNVAAKMAVEGGEVNLGKLGIKAIPGLQKFGMRLTGEGVTGQIAFQGTSNIGKRFVATATTALIKDGVVGSTTAGIRSTALNVAGAVDDKMHGRRANVGKRLQNIADSTISGYGYGAGFGMAGRFTSGELATARMTVASRLSPVRNIQAKVNPPLENTTTGGAAKGRTDVNAGQTTQPAPDTTSSMRRLRNSGNSANLADSSLGQKAGQQQSAPTDTTVQNPALNPGNKSNLGDNLPKQKPQASTGDTTTQTQNGTTQGDAGQSSTAHKQAPASQGDAGQSTSPLHNSGNKSNLSDTSLGQRTPQQQSGAGDANQSTAPTPILNSGNKSNLGDSLKRQKTQTNATDTSTQVQNTPAQSDSGQTASAQKQQEINPKGEAQQAQTQNRESTTSDQTAKSAQAVPAEPSGLEKAASRIYRPAQTETETSKLFKDTHRPDGEWIHESVGSPEIQKQFHLDQANRLAEARQQAQQAGIPYDDGLESMVNPGPSDMLRGWKIHLNVPMDKNNPLVSEITKFLDSERVAYKVGQGGDELDGTGMTIYCGPRDFMEKIADKLRTNFGDKLPKASASGDEMINDVAAARFDVERQAVGPYRYGKYGSYGVSILSDDPGNWVHFPGAANEAEKLTYFTKVHNMLVDKYGSYYTGSKAYETGDLNFKPRPVEFSDNLPIQKSPAISGDTTTQTQNRPVQGDSKPSTTAQEQAEAKANVSAKQVEETRAKQAQPESTSEKTQIASAELERMRQAVVGHDDIEIVGNTWRLKNWPEANELYKTLQSKGVSPTADAPPIKEIWISQSGNRVIELTDGTEINAYSNSLKISSGDGWLKTKPNGEDFYFGVPKLRKARIAEIEKEMKENGIAYNSDNATGWKIHLPVADSRLDPVTREIADFLMKEKIEFKIGHGGEASDGKGMTIYIGDRDSMMRVANQLETKFGDRIPSIPKGAETLTGNEMIGKTGKISARFDADRSSLMKGLPSENFWHAYGPNGVLWKMKHFNKLFSDPAFKALPEAEKAKFKAECEQESRQDMAKYFGAYFTGTEK